RLAAVAGHRRVHRALGAVRRPYSPDHPHPGRFHHLPDLRGGRNEPGAVRPAGGGAGADRRVSDRVLGPQVRHVLPRRVRQHDHGLGARGPAVLRRLVPVGRAAGLRLPAEGRAVPIPLHLAPRHVPTPSLRHADAARLEGLAAAGDAKRDRDRDHPCRGGGVAMPDKDKPPEARPEHPTPLRGRDEGVPAKPEGQGTSIAADIGALTKGLRTTLGEFFSPPVTLEYPEEKTPRSERYRGRHYLRRYDNGLERCIGCELCAAACPVGCIYVLSAENDPADPVSPGERYAERYEINLMRCIYCGYCAEACPTEAITLGPRYDLADYRRERTVVTKAELLESWSGFDAGRRPASPVGAGADQTGREELDPGPSPRLAWDAAEALRGSRGAPVSGDLGIPADVPTVAEPGGTPP